MLDRFAGDGPLPAMTDRESRSTFADPVPTEDNAVPSGNSAAAELCLLLGDLPFEGMDRFARHAQLALEVMASRMERHPFAFGKWLSTAEIHLRGVTTVAVVGDEAAPSAQAMRNIARRHFRPGMVILTGPAASEAYKGAQSTPTAYVCRRRSCLPPVRTPEALSDILSYP